MEQQDKDPQVRVLKKEIRLDVIFSSLWQHWRTYLVPLAVTFVLSSALILCVPRYYEVEVMLAPESSEGGSKLGGSLGGLASMAGINLGSLSSSDAIIPMFYPDVIKSTDFLVPLFNAHVQTKDGAFSGTMADYLTTGVSVPWWDKAKGAVKEMFSPQQDTLTKSADGRFIVDPFRLNRAQSNMAKAIKGSISCNVDKKTDIITLKVVMQDPLVAAMFADSVKQALQNFITEYRTKKAKDELVHYRQMRDSAQQQYTRAQQAYSQFVDTHQDLVLMSYKSQEEMLENELQNAYTLLTQMKQQCILAEGKLTERTPAFTTIQNATVPLQPAGPKRTIFVLAMLMLCVLVTSGVILVRDPHVKL